MFLSTGTSTPLWTNWLGCCPLWSSTLGLCFSITLTHIRVEHRLQLSLILIKNVDHSVPYAVVSNPVSPKLINELLFDLKVKCLNRLKNRALSIDFCTSFAPLKVHQDSHKSMKPNWVWTHWNVQTSKRPNSVNYLEVVISTCDMKPQLRKPHTVPQTSSTDLLLCCRQALL